MIIPMTKDHMEAVNKKLTTKVGLERRAEYCRFMAATAANVNDEKLWAISAEKREREAAECQ